MENRQIEGPLVRAVLREFREGLEKLYGDRLVQLILFGSRARRGARPDSGINVMLVLKGPVDLTREMCLVDTRVDARSYFFNLA
jgi:predicted nucleotidyltransferase